jgi:hypothetical protein
MAEPNMLAAMSVYLMDATHRMLLHRIRGMLVYSNASSTVRTIHSTHASMLHIQTIVMLILRC